MKTPFQVICLVALVLLVLFFPVAAAPVADYQPVCTPPVCPSGKYVCLQKDGCPGGCGYSCGTVSPQITVPPTKSGIETTVILMAIGFGVVFFAKRRD